MRWARLFATLLVVGLLTGQPVIAAEGDPAGHGSGTDVRFEGNTVFITVNLTILIRHLDPETEATMRAQLDAAADYWNRGLAGKPYFECFELRIEIVPRFIHPVNRTNDDPAHQIRTYGSSDVGTMADGRGLPSSLDPTGLADPTADYAGPYEHAITGYWPPWLFQDAAALAHELGHMFGLGDDYARDQNGDVTPLDGRDGTLMDSGDAIDSTLAARVGDTVIEAGYADRLPSCWRGSADVSSFVEYPAGSASCQDGWKVALTFVADAEGTVKGQGTADLTSGPTCTFPVGPAVQHVEFLVAGKRDATSFSLEFSLDTWSPTGNEAFYAGAPAMWAAVPGCPAPVSIGVSGAAGTGQGMWQCQSGSPPATYGASGTFEVECVATCPPNP